MHCDGMSWQCIYNNTVPECQQFVPQFCTHLSAKQEKQWLHKASVLWYMTPQQWGIGSKRFESMQCPKLQRSKFRTLRAFRDIPEELAASILKVEQSLIFTRLHRIMYQKSSVNTIRPSHPTLKYISSKPVLRFGSWNNQTDVSPGVPFTIIHTMQRHIIRQPVRTNVCLFKFK